MTTTLEQIQTAKMSAQQAKLTPIMLRISHETANNLCTIHPTLFTIEKDGDKATITKPVTVFNVGNATLYGMSVDLTSGVEHIMTAEGTRFDLDKRD